MSNEPRQLPPDVEAILETLVAELMMEREAIGVLLHGSAVTGVLDAESDLDLLCVTDGVDWTSTEMRQVKGRKVEVRHSPIDDMQRELRQYQRVNNNFMLTTLTDARVLAERDAKVGELIDEARRMVIEGPPKANSREIRNSRQFLRNRLKDLRRLAASGRHGECRVLADHLFHRSLYAYCKFHRLWGNKFLLLLKALKQHDETLAMAIDEFLSASTSTELIAALERILDLVMEPVGWGSEFDSTGRQPVRGRA